MHPIIRSLLGIITLASTFTYAEELKYSIAPNFFEENPGGQALGPCHGGAVIDRAGNIYISTDTERGIVVFSHEGKFLRLMGPTRVHGLELRDEGGREYIYAARPTDHEVIKLKLNGEREWAIGFFGGPGAEEGKFNTCHGIALDTRLGKPLLLVCNRNNNRVEYWDLEGNFVRVIQKDLRMPAAVHIRGDYAVFPELQGRVTVLDKEGKIVAQVGDNPNEKQRANFGLPPDQWKEGICNSPHGASIDKDGDLIVTEWSQFGHLHKFVKGKQGNPR